MHQSAKNVVLDRGVDGWTSIDEDILRDEEIEDCWIVSRDSAQDPAGGEDGAGPEGEESDTPKTVVTVFYRLLSTFTNFQ